MRPHSTASILVGLLLSRAVSSAVISSPEEGIIASRQAVNSSELSLVTFNLDEISVVHPGQTVYSCDPDTEGCEEEIKRRDTTGTYNICAAGRTYTQSECFKGNILKVSCRDINGRVWPSYVRCESTEICIQNSLDPPYARCKPIVDLVVWKTAPSGGNTKSEKYVHSVNKKSKTRMGNMYFDNNNNAIKLSQTDFFHEPGSGSIGSVYDANRAYSNIVDWATTDNIKIDIETGGAGSISVYSFIA
ncbi:hypothetical protein IFR05_016331 [Cadophora sp. M221]|nr:hypothetical protein IFR05_016331 [Cadophora sp. M221]